MANRLCYVILAIAFSVSFGQQSPGNQGGLTVSYRPQRQTIRFLGRGVSEPLFHEGWDGNACPILLIVLTAVSMALTCAVIVREC